MPRDPRRVLIVDDDSRICELIRSALSFQQIECEITTDAREAREKVRCGDYAVLVADVSMPGVGGLDLLEEAHENDRGCNVILITGVSQRETLAKAILLGAYDYLEKPFQIEELVALVEKAAQEGSAAPQLSVRAAEAIETGAQAKLAATHTAYALARAVEAKDPYTREHSDHVTHYAMSLAREIHLPGARMEHLRIASLLHDVGKIGIPDSILTKPDSLTRGEFDSIRTHPTIGADILTNISLLRREAEIVRSHHENWDGSGYPGGLAGEDIPVEARLIRVADSIDAILSPRSYKGACGVDWMLAELRRCAGQDFDPRIAEATITWCRKNPHLLLLPEKQGAVA